METTKKADTETVRIARMSETERRLVRALSPEERKAILVDAAKARLQVKQ